MSTDICAFFVCIFMMYGIYLYKYIGEHAPRTPISALSRAYIAHKEICRVLSPTLAIAPYMELSIYILILYLYLMMHIYISHILYLYPIPIYRGFDRRHRLSLPLIFPFISFLSFKWAYRSLYSSPMICFFIYLYMRS